MSRPPQRPPAPPPRQAPLPPPPRPTQAAPAPTSPPIAAQALTPTPAPIAGPAAQFGRAPVEPDLLGSGIVSGPGNHGTANTAQLQGHAGTGADRLSIPRNLKFGTGTVTP